MVFKIAVIGGGLGGLAAAHALTRAVREGRAKGIEVVVYEKREVEDGLQRYPIHLDPDGRKALRHILNSGDYEAMVKRSAQGTTHGGIAITTPRFERLFRMRQYEGEQPQFIHRWVLKEILSQDVKVVRGKKVVEVHDMDGGVEVVFEDGTPEMADLVIGADGVGSILRRQLYPSHEQFARLPYLNIQMKLNTTPSQLPKLPDVNGINLIVGTHNNSLLLVPFHGDPITPQVLVPTAESPQGTQSNTLEALTRDHPNFLFAILTTHTFEGWETLTESGWRSKVVNLLQADQADEDLIRAFSDDIIPGTIGKPWQVVRCDPKNAVPYNGGRVILIGDAAHAMPPQAGAGANTALLDAHILTQVILSCKEVRAHGDPILSLLPSFHEAMMFRANRFVSDATRRLYLSNKAGWNVHAQRATLRIMDRVWPLASWMGSTRTKRSPAGSSYH